MLPFKRKLIGNFKLRISNVFMNNLKPTVWYKVFSNDPRNKIDSILERLGEAGIRFVEEGEDEPSEIGLLFINDQESQENMCAFIDKWTASYHGKLIAVRTSFLPLEGQVEWEMYQQGVSYIIDWYNMNQPEAVVAAYVGRWLVIKRILDSELIKDNMVGESRAWKATLETIIETSYFTDAPVLIMGESGTGKELVSRLIHTLDKRKDKEELVVLDCASIVPELSGSEFFGHEKGAFTNAVGARDGAFALANNGTLFLDEIGELPMRLQGELLRVMQEGTFKRVGSNIWNKTRFRLVSATNRDLPAEIEKDNFRHDLFFRISTFIVTLPSLKERKQDIPLLAYFFLKKYLKGKRLPPIDDSVMFYLLNRDYKGNIRELEHLVHRIAIRHVGEGSISIGDIPEMDRPQGMMMQMPWQDANFKLAIKQAVSRGVCLKEIKERAANTAMDIAIENESGNLRKAAQSLGVSDRTIQLYCAARKNFMKELQ
ncbi:sigma-54-dependent Fis family transcriptional regulator [Marinilabiliaceae bacterium JC017]|nr:sigma-54-dependent Fis family transcriptional regulator [Marinilabiliaceae bacterium JC017]